MQPLVSIIVPVYNTGEYLYRCLSSIVNQTYPNLQIITVDDASSDDSVVTLRTFADSDPRVHLIAHPVNLGVSAARNSGLTTANGDYVVFVDGDDWIEPDYIATMVQTIRGSGFDLVVAPFILEKESGPREPAERHQRSRKLTRQQFLDAVRSPLGQVRGYLWNKIFRRSIIQQHNIHFDTSITMMEDELFTVEYAVRANYFYFSGQAGYHYVVRQGSATAESPVKLLPQQIMSLHRVNRIIATIGRDRTRDLSSESSSD